MSFLLPAECEALLNEMEVATKRLADLNPADFASVNDALAQRALAIERFTVCIAACQRPLDPDLTTRIEKTLATGVALAVRLTLVRANATAELASLGREKRLLDALAGAMARNTSPGLNCDG